MLSMMRRGVWGVLFAACLGAAGCADNVKKVNTPPDGRVDAGKDEDSGSANGDDNSGGDSDGKDNGATTAGSSGGRIAINDAPNCPWDDPSTPGSECDSIVTCGGSLAKPTACPLLTHSCCVSGPPVETTVNCYEGKSKCEVLEAINPCDGSEDCADGMICCFMPPPVAMTACRALDDCGEGRVFCHTDDDCPEGQTCTPNKDASWWGFCN